MADAKDRNNYLGDYNIAIATEVLEHIDNDLEVVGNIKKGVNFLFSLPTFKCNGHMRWFNSAPEVANYYFECLYIKNMIRMRNPNNWLIGWGVTR
jgi:hypothetical protein